MAANDPCIVVLQLTGGNDYINTMIPYNNPLYRDNRPAVGIPDNKIIHLDKDYGIPDYMAPMKKFWDDKKLAMLHGVGFQNSPRSHFRAMDIWHTCEPEKVGTEGWLGRVAREFDPKKENVVTRRQHGAEPAALAGRARRPGGVRRRPLGAVRLPADRCRATSARMCSIASPRCTARRSAAAR